MLELDDVEARMAARRVLADAYRSDVELLAQEFAARIRRGEFDRSLPLLHATLDAAIARHPRVADDALALETIAFSEHRDAIAKTYAVGWSEAARRRWATFEPPIDLEIGLPYEITMPEWSAIAYHAFGYDVDKRLEGLLGDTPERYIVVRLGGRWP